MRVLWLLPFALVACVHTDAVADRQMEALRVGVDETEAEQDRVNQRAEMITETPDERAARPVYPQKDAPPPPALQRTVQIGEDPNAGQSDDPNDPEARPEIKLTGNAAPSAPRASRKSRRSDDDGTAEPSSRKKRVDASDTAAAKENR